MKEVFQVIQQKRVEKLNPIYLMLFCNKLGAVLAAQYLAQVCKLKRINEVSAHQFQLDLEELKNVLLHLPGPSAPASYAQNLLTSVLKIEKRVKVLGYPDDVMRDAYASLVDEPH